jgi:hypothetical protein
MAGTGKWGEDEDIKLEAAVRMHEGGKNWVAIAALVPGRTQIQCSARCKALDPNPHQPGPKNVVFGE